MPSKIALFELLPLLLPLLVSYYHYFELKLRLALSVPCGCSSVSFAINPLSLSLTDLELHESFLALHLARLFDVAY
jgi:hypothetical protein